MEFIKGRTLNAVVEQNGPLRTRAAFEWQSSSARPSARCIEAGLLHRDIKAQNVMRESGGRHRADGLRRWPRGRRRDARRPRRRRHAALPGAGSACRREPAIRSTTCTASACCLHFLATAGFPGAGDRPSGDAHGCSDIGPPDYRARNRSRPGGTVGVRQGIGCRASRHGIRVSFRAPTVGTGMVAAAAAMTIAASTTRLLPRLSAGAPPAHLMPFTSDRAVQESPAYSPDGTESPSRDGLRRRRALHLRQGSRFFRGAAPARTGTCE